MAYISVWLFPEDGSLGRQLRIVKTGDPKKVLLQIIEDCIYYGHLTKDDLWILYNASFELPVKREKKRKCNNGRI